VFRTGIASGSGCPNIRAETGLAGIGRPN